MTCLLQRKRGLEALLKFDAARRASFVDRLLDMKTSLDDFSANIYMDSASLADSGYSATIDDKGVTLTRDGQDVSVQKRFSARDDNSFVVDYTAVIGEKTRAAGHRFCVEFNLILPCCDGLPAGMSFLRRLIRRWRRTRLPGLTRRRASRGKRGRPY